jgi:hypothetical protein
MDPKTKKILYAVLIILTVVLIASVAYMYVFTRKYALAGLASATGTTPGTCVLTLTITGTPAAAWVGKKVKVVSSGIPGVSGLKVPIASVSGTTLTTAPVAFSTSTCPSGTLAPGDYIRLFHWA